MQARMTMWTYSAVAVMAVTASVSAAPTKVGEERPYSLTSPAEYPFGPAHREVTWSETVASPGATFLRLHFEKFNLPPGDYLTVSSPDGSDFWTYTGQGTLGTGEFWSFIVESDRAVVELHSGTPPAETARGEHYGFVVDRIAHGTVSLSGDGAEAPTPDVICGTDGRRNAACYTFNTKPVARLAFQSGGSSYLCTGWLVAGSNSSTMLTNNHCFKTQSEVNTVQARFNYQYSACTGTTLATYSSYNGGTFLKTSSGLDYTLLTLLGNPEATWGEYTATSKSLTVGTLIHFPQHPGGQPKKVGYYEDSAQTTRCKLATVNATYGTSTAGSQTGYGCDSEGGSSGSPIVETATGRVVGLHHYGGVSSSPCLNSATQMRQICSNAGSLLSCATN